MRQIIRHPQADAEWEAILAYWIDRNQSTRYAHDLDERLDTLLLLLASQPLIGKATSVPEIRVAMLPPYGIFYCFSDTCLEILAVWDTRRAPASAPFPFELNEP